jgi:sulfopyruvate decarboxylase subunit alpha
MDARLVLAELRRHGVTHVVGLPDNSSAGLLRLLTSAPDIRIVPVTREGEAFAVAAGLWLGGAVPVVVIQNTGLLESGDALRGTITRMRVPLVCVITYRGFRTRGTGPQPPAADPESLSRPDLDSVAVVTEPTLSAWGIPYTLMHERDGVAPLSEAFDRASALDHAHAVLTTADFQWPVSNADER